ncbi:MAG: hypothetical protein KTR22_13960 [Flavobacteriaceae bacterium]|nr:hypothetical protein [Flavobacteriaceae bacterium]
MKKKIVFLVVALVLVVGAYTGYKYLYKDHRNIAEEVSVFSGSAEEVQELFATGQRTDLLNKTITVTGMVSQVETTSVTLDEKVQCVFVETQNFNQGMQITVKGRCIGYDDLFEIVKLDQSQRID